MSLNWDVTNTTTDVTTEAEYPITDKLVWSTIAIDLGGIASSNVNYFYARLRVWETMVHDSDEPFTTFEQVSKRIGLRTNVADKPVTAFFKKMTDIQHNGRSFYKQMSPNAIKAVYYTALVEAEMANTVSLAGLEL